MLWPGNSLVTTIPLDKSTFVFLGKPGNYRLLGNYSSSGLSYPPTYAKMGISKEDIADLSIESWQGKASTNVLSLQILPGRAKR